jgi:predicted SAM-dependent methyltransferase
MHGILETFYKLICRFNKSQSVSSDSLNTLFYIDEFLKDIKESETAEQAKLLFERHKIESTIAITPEGLRKAVDLTCRNLQKYISNADLMDAMYLSNVLDPR